MIDKKGASLSSFTIATLFCLGFVLIATFMFADLNHQYGDSINYGFNDTTNSFQKFIDYQDTAQQSATGGDIAFSGITGMTLSSAGTLFFGVLGILGTFISGSFIYQTVSSLYLGSPGVILGRIFQILYVLTLWVFIPLFIVLNRKT